MHNFHQDCQTVFYHFHCWFSLLTVHAYLSSASSKIYCQCPVLPFSCWAWSWMAVPSLETEAPMVSYSWTHHCSSFVSNRNHCLGLRLFPSGFWQAGSAGNCSLAGLWIPVCIYTLWIGWSKCNCLFDKARVVLVCFWVVWFVQLVFQDIGNVVRQMEFYQWRSI